VVGVRAHGAAARGDGGGGGHGQRTRGRGGGPARGHRGREWCGGGGIDRGVSAECPLRCGDRARGRPIERGLRRRLAPWHTRCLSRHYTRVLSRFRRRVLSRHRMRCVSRRRGHVLRRHHGRPLTLSRPPPLPRREPQHRQRHAPHAHHAADHVHRRQSPLRDLHLHGRAAQLQLRVDREHAEAPLGLEVPHRHAESAFGQRHHLVLHAARAHARALSRELRSAYRLELRLVRRTRGPEARRRAQREEHRSPPRPPRAWTTRAAPAALVLHATPPRAPPRAPPRSAGPGAWRAAAGTRGPARPGGPDSSRTRARAPGSPRPARASRTTRAPTNTPHAPRSWGLLGEAIAQLATRLEQAPAQRAGANAERARGVHRRHALQVDPHQRGAVVGGELGQQRHRAHGL
jgi:hypothetical protein